MQAVILAGGFGKRLRPLTSTKPKPMVPILGRPVLAYILDLLCAADIRDITLTLGYQPMQIESFLKSYAQGKAIRLRTVPEEEPLGTAGGVRAAMQGAKEPFFVLSGDCICDFDLRKALQTHRLHHAEATMLCKALADPREYGLVQTDANGKILGFLEKPDWSAVSGKYVNTGIYILNPSVLSEIRKGQACDFSKDVFPRLLQKGAALYAHFAKGYWCDIGDIDAYRTCQQDLLQGKSALPLPKMANGIFAKGELPQGNYTLLPPVYLGAHTKIGNGAVIGPNSVLDDRVTVEASAKVRSSILLSGAKLGRNTSVTDAVICENAVAESGVQIFEQSVIGAQSRIEQGAFIGPNVKIWPYKTVEQGKSVSENLKYGTKSRHLFDENGLLGVYGSALEPAALANLGRTLAELFKGEKIGIAYSDEPQCCAAFHILSGAMTAQGANVWSFGKAFLSKMYYLTAFCAFPLGIFLNQQQDRLQIRLFRAGGIPLERACEREIENTYQNREFSQTDMHAVCEITDMQRLENMYVKELLQAAGTALEHQSVRIRSENPQICLLLADTLYRAKVQDGDELTFKIHKDGTTLTAFHRDCGWVGYSKLLALCCKAELEEGHDVAAPMDAPYILGELASARQQKVFRYLQTPPDDSDRAARVLAGKQLFTRDALLLCMRLLGILERSGKALPALLKTLPEFYDRETTVPISFSPTELLQHLDGMHAEKQKEGVSVQTKLGHALLIPTKSGRRIRILTEGKSYEISKELSENLKERLLND